MHMPSGHELLWALIGAAVLYFVLHMKAKKASA